MARKLRVEYEGAIYHVVIRGVDRRRLFDDEADRERLVGRLSAYAVEYGVRVYLYCLMTNHVHLLVETPQANLGRFMHRLQTAYTVYYNRRHGRAGHLFQGRYKAILVEGDEYLLKLSRYIHLNPVHVGMLKQAPVEERRKALRTYRWSSYRTYLGKTAPLAGLDVGPVLTFLGDAAGARTRREYARYVEEGLAESDDDLARLRSPSPWGLGGEAFVARVQALYETRVQACRHPEDVSFRRPPTSRLSGATILGVVGEVLNLEAGWERARRHDLNRAMAAAVLCRYGGLRQREVAGLLGLGTGAAVSHQLKRLERARSASRTCATALAAIEARLTALHHTAHQVNI